MPGPRVEPTKAEHRPGVTGPWWRSGHREAWWGVQNLGRGVRWARQSEPAFGTEVTWYIRALVSPYKCLITVWAQIINLGDSGRRLDLQWETEGTLSKHQSIILSNLNPRGLLSVSWGIAQTRLGQWHTSLSDLISKHRRSSASLIGWCLCSCVHSCVFVCTCVNAKLTVNSTW